MEKVPSSQQGHNRMLFLTASSATFAFFVLGIAFGWPSPMLPKLENGEYEPHLTADEGSWAASIITIGAAIVPIPAGYVVDIVGRKTMLLFTAAPYIISWMMQIFSKSVAVLYVARFLAGLSMGTSMSVGSMYLGEIAVDNLRGALGTIFQIMMTSGVMFVYCVGPYVSPTTLSIIGAILPIIFFVIFVWMPESPYFYLLKNKRKDAEKSLMRLRSAKNPETVQEELLSMERFVEENKRDKGSFRDLFGDKRNRKGLMICVGLMMVQVFSGNNALMNYSTQIFQESNNDLSAEVCVMITGAVQVVLSVICSSIVDIAGRRPMLLMSTVGCMISQTVLGVFFYLKDETDTDMTSWNWLPVTAVLVYLIVYILGLASLPLAMLGELFPTSVKGLASSITVTIMCIAGFVVIKLYQVIADNYGSYVVFWLFAACCVLGTIFIAVVVPETKGKTLMQIYSDLGS